MGNRPSKEGRFFSGLWYQPVAAWSRCRIREGREYRRASILSERLEEETRSQGKLNAVSRRGIATIVAISFTLTAKANCLLLDLGDVACNTQDAIVAAKRFLSTNCIR